MYAKNELMFPHYAIAHLRDARGEAWGALIDRLAALPQAHEDVLAFMLMMIRLNGCMACETDSYRAMRGCAACALQTLRRFKGSDQDLLRLYQQALEDLQNLAGRPGMTRLVVDEYALEGIPSNY